MSDMPNYDLDKYVGEKLEKLKNSDRDLRSVFLLMTDEPDKVFAESNDGYKITKITYTEFKERTERMAGSLLAVLSGIPVGSIVGIYMNNSEEWLEIFWALLMLGYRTLLVNNRMSRSVLEDIIRQYDVKAVISDNGKLGDNTIDLDVLKERFVSGVGSKVAAEKDGWADEIILMSSGTTSHVKLCVYNGETMYCQICDSARIIRECKAVKSHCEGSLKQLTFLPFYHVFGLVAVFMWFGFFGRTFVFLRDFGSETILNTVRRHKVTHIFSIPLLWNTVYDTVIRTAKERGEYDKLMKGIRISEKLSGTVFGKIFTRLAFKSVREQIFGDSIRFLISGGSAISEDVLRFFNAIGYHLANGYGMTEIGITSVELSSKRERLTDKAVGMPFSSVEYKISDEGELLVRGQTMADIVMENGAAVNKCDEDGWFHTNDLAREENGRYFILGRRDDVMIGPSGENINPDVLEEKINIEGAEEICIVRYETGQGTVPVLLVRISPYASNEAAKLIAGRAGETLKKLDMDRTIAKVILTRDALMDANDFKLNRKKIAEKLAGGIIREADPENEVFEISELTERVAEIIGKVIGKRSEEVTPGADIFFELGGSSLDYYTIVMELAREFRVSFPSDGDMRFKTAGEFADYIEKNR